MSLLLTSFMLAASFLASEKIQFVATVPDLKDLVEQIGGEHVEGVSLSSGRQDPHFIDPKPTYIVKLRHADLFVLNGLDLEIGYVPPLLEGARNRDILRGGKGYLDASAGISVLEIPVAGTTRAEGDIHPFGNPHYLLDPLNAGIVAGNVASKLKELDPEHAVFFEERLRSFRQKLDEAMFGKELVAAVGGSKLERLARESKLDRFLESESIGERKLETMLAGWMGKLRALRGVKVVPFHKNLHYLCARFGFQEASYVEPKPGISPSASHLVELEKLIREQKPKWILTHSFYDERVPRLLAEKTGIRVLQLPAAVGGEPGTETVISLFDTIVNRLAAGSP